MSDLRDYLEVNVPLTLGGHPMDACLNPEVCIICSEICQPETMHFFVHSTLPCRCGLFKNTRHYETEVEHGRA